MPPTDVSLIPEMSENLAVGMDDAGKREKLERDYWIYRQTFEGCLIANLPNLHAARITDETILRPFRYCHSSWRDNTAALRQELLELSQRWVELGLPSSCPYQPTEKDVADHVKQYDDFEIVQKFKVFLVRARRSNSDGWIPAENWESAEEAHRLAFDEWTETVKHSEDPDMTEERGRRLWLWNER